MTPAPGQRIKLTFHHAATKTMSGNFLCIEGSRWVFLDDNEPRRTWRFKRENVKGWEVYKAKGIER